MLDLEANTLPGVVEMITDSQIENGLLKADLKDKVMYTLLRKHRHQTKKSNLRSLADIGKTVSSASRLFSTPDNARNPLETSVPCLMTRNSEELLRAPGSPSMGWPSSPTTTHRNLTSSSLNDISDKPEKDQLKNKFMKKLPRDAEASNVLVGEVDFLDSPFVAFVRLQQAVMLGALTEVPVPTRFLFILLGPKGKAKSYHEIGRAIATLMSDEVFHEIAYKAKDRQDLLAGIDEFLDEVIVLPPGEWDPTIRIEPPKSLPSSDKRKNMYAGGDSTQMNGDTPHSGGQGGGGHAVGDELKRTGKFCGGLILDIKRKAPFFFSDFYDALHIQSLSAILFIYLGTVTNAITFGGLLGDATENMQGVLESFLGTAVTGAVFCLLAGQPLIILSSTGPVLVFERLLFNFSREHDFDYLEFRLWIGLWSAFFCLALVATDASFLVQYFTRFTEEGFSSLISFIFIYDAFKKMLKLADYYPINSDYKIDYVTQYDCMCMAPTVANSSDVYTDPLGPTFIWTVNYSDTRLNASWSSLSKKECLKYGGELVGKACNFVPDITLISFILFFEDLPKISEESSEELECSLTLGELYKSLHEMESGKAPGIDGLPVDFLKVFWSDLGGDLLEVANNVATRASTAELSFVTEIFSLCCEVEVVFKELLTMNEISASFLHTVSPYRNISSDLKDKVLQANHQLLVSQSCGCLSAYQTGP
ncbi:electrogenic sodium bicarbonate cotransporter 1-like [Carassius gibelio]|uniref:electrogenic sodium bicarbonate cotransporter 1-like n=1 Tax=Carassius gibelio TaxID=101364 RepID=UPI002279C690|nr:electrogenic sodium bicarbonate cotransporter 1-like [Carassius gibelio]